MIPFRRLVGPAAAGVMTVLAALILTAERAAAPAVGPTPLLTLAAAPPVVMQRVESVSPPPDSFDIQVIGYLPYDAPWVVYSPDRTLRAVIERPFSRTGHATVIEQATRRTLLTLDMGEFFMIDAAFSSDNRRLALTGQVWGWLPQVTLVSLDTGGMWSLSDRLPGDRATSPVFSHDGATLVFLPVSGDSCSRLHIGEAQFWDVAARRPYQVALPFRATVVAFSPDDRWVALGDSLGFCMRGRPGLAVLDLDTGTVMFQADLDTTGAAFSPDGRFLMTVEGTTMFIPAPILHLWDLHTGAEVGRCEIAPAPGVDNVFARFEADRIQVVAQIREALYVGEIALPGCF